MGCILVVDDDPVIRQLLTDVLEISGHEVRIAGDGLAAIRVLDAFQPDFVVLDVMMPHLDGYAVLRRIRQRSGERIPVLMLTAAAHPEAAAQAWAEGVDYYLAKPFLADEVTNLIDGVLSRAPSTVPPPA